MPLSPSLFAQAELVSFDLFETLLIRPFLRPEDLHYLVGWKLRQQQHFSLTPELWLDARVQAERRARALSQYPEVTLEDIYRELSPALNLSANTRLAAMRLECATETNLVSPISKMKELLRRLRAERKRIAFLSDMYLEKKVIVEMLQRLEILESGDIILISSDTKHAKWNGTMFDLVPMIAKVSKRRILHIGDNSISDLKRPRQKGIKAYLFEGTKLNRYEAAAEKIPTKSQFLRSALVGSSRVTRLSRAFEDPRQQSIWDTSSSLAAPLLFGFVLWTLLEARRLKLRKLFFLARDGQILTQIATLVATWLGCDIESRYLLASRRALFFPALDLDNSSYIEIIARMTIGRSLKDVATTLEISCDSLLSQLSKSSPPQLHERDIVCERTSHEIAEVLKHSYLAGPIRQRSKDRLKAILSYFSREGVFADSNLGIVDIGWKGNLQFLLSQIFLRASISTPNITGLYFGLYDHPPFGSGSSLTYTKTPRPFNAELLELFCAADHGPVKGYRCNENGEGSAIFLSERNKEAERWGISTQQEAIISVVKKFLQVAPRDSVNIAELQALLRNWGQSSFVQFHRTPSELDAETYGSFLHAMDANHSDFREIAPCTNVFLSLKQLAQSHFQRGDSLWPHATLVRSASRVGLARGAKMFLKTLEHVRIMHTNKERP